MKLFVIFDQEFKANIRIEYSYDDQNYIESK